MPIPTSAGPLVAAADVADFPGAPFSDRILAAACDEVRAEAGWHIAPEVTETVTVDGTNGRSLILPSLHVVAVTEVRDVTDPAAPIVLDGWTLKPYGMLLRHYWPSPESTIEVDLTHGYPSAPLDLLPLIAGAANAAGLDSTVVEEDAGAFGVKRVNLTTLKAHLAAARSAIDPYRVRTGF